MYVKKDFYTYTEAQAATQTLGINGPPEYHKRYKEDPRLPSSPQKRYADGGWTNWYDFLGNEKPNLYTSYAEVQAAARTLGIKSPPEYQKRYKEDPRLPSSPPQRYADGGWTNWYDFLGNEKPNLYTSYAEAQAAALALGIKSQADYGKHFRQDPRLPACPNHVYANAGWTDWYAFLRNEKTNFYATYTEAQTAAKALGIKSQPDYKKRYHEDPRLPAAPYQRYANFGWKSWYDFLGKEKPNLYSICAEAQAAAQALGIKSRCEYQKHFREDPRLPAFPSKVYANGGWTDWYAFLGTENRTLYATYAEAQAAALALGIKRRPDYLKRYREDPRLPSSPYQVYANAGWTDWYAFLGNEKPNLYASYLEAQAAVQALGVMNQPDYKKRVREDPRLPASPHLTYANAGWANWYDFLGNDKPNLYATYADAQAAVHPLGIKTLSDYKKRYREDPRLPATPHQTYANIGWTNWYDFLGNDKPNLYASYAEAQAAVLALGIKSQPDYKKRFREDPRLPATPNQIYANVGWTNWYDFLGKNKPNLYVSYAEAQAAALALGIKSQPDYKKRVREDPRLPATPNQVYANAGWTGWYAFLGNEKPNFYSTFAEAQAAAQKLGIKRHPDYLKRYREDPRLSASPHQTYSKAGWTNWYDFLGKEKPDLYATYAEAQAAVQALGIKNYQKRYGEDPRLPSSPKDVYANIGWTSWYDFLGTEAPYDAANEYPIIWADLERWLSDSLGHTTKRSAIRALLGSFFRGQGLPDDPRYLLLRTNPFNTEAYQQFIDSQAESVKAPYHGKITAFFGWLLDVYCTDDDNYERIVLPEYRNPFLTVLAGFADSLGTYRPSQSTKVPLGYEYILRARQFLVPNGEQVMQTRPCLKDMPHLQEFFRSDWRSADESIIDRNDPNCVWRIVEKNGRVKGYEIWSPVRFIALYTLLRCPLRGQQILWLDSGEADSEIAILDAETGRIRWEKNTGHLAGKGSKKRRPQAAIQRGSKDEPKFYITTNKTSRVEGGYEIEWIPEDLVYWFILLRNWQAKYNPLSAPTNWSAIGLDSTTNSKILQARGTQCFLFRTGTLGTPMSTSTAFTRSFPALLYQIQRDGESLAIPDPEWPTRQRYVSPYTPHCLRVSLITAFIIDGDLPIAIVSKLVGHSSLVMTIYYTKLNSGQMRRVMGDAEKRAAQLVTEARAELIRRQGLQPIRHQLITTDGNRALFETDVPNSACVVFDHGICPMSASACEEGGELRIENTAQTVYIPVQIGYLGKKNCPHCRFFVTGIPFLGGLVAIANEVALEIHAESKRYQNYTAEVDRLEQERYDACQENLPDTQQPKLKQAVACQQQSAAKLDSLLADYIAISRYVQGCLKLINEGERNSENQDAVRLIAADGVSEVAVAFEESKTDYHLLAEICQNATIYQSANPSRAVPLITQAIDRMAENNGLAPAMFRLSDEQKLVVANELNRLLLQRLGSWERIDDLFAGDLMLLDIDTHEPALTRISTEIQRLLSRPNGAHQFSLEVPVNE